MAEPNTNAVKFEYNKAYFKNEADFNKYIGNLDITLEQYRQIDTRVHEAARDIFVGREQFPITTQPGDVGVQSIGYDILTHMSDATIGYQFAQDEDTVQLTRYNVNVPIISKKYRIGYRDLRSSELSGQPLNAKNIDSAALQVAELEDYYLLQGWSLDGGTEWEISGLYNAAGNSYDGSDWATVANIVVDINAAIALMIDDHIMGPYNLVISSHQQKDINQLISSTLGSYADWIIKRLGGGKIYVSSCFADNYGVLVKAGPHNYFEYKMTADMDHYEWRDPDSRDLFGRTFSVGLPIYYDTNAICQLYDIGT